MDVMDHYLTLTHWTTCLHSPGNLLKSNHPPTLTLLDHVHDVVIVVVCLAVFYVSSENGGGRLKNTCAGSRLHLSKSSDCFG